MEIRHSALLNILYIKDNKDIDLQQKILTEYIGQNAAATYNVNAREGRQYQAYGENLAVQKQLITNPGQNIMYYTRSPATFEDSLYDYFWAIGASNNFSIYPSSTELGITFACCI